MNDNRTDEEKEIEVEIFGYLDPFPPIPGSFKAETIRLAERARILSVPDSLVIEPLKAAVDRMRKVQADIIDTVSNIM